jgi:NADH-quinone oxidoreductase subunit N
MISPLTLEVIVLLTGILLLFLESFAKSGEKKGIAYSAIFILFWTFWLTFFAEGNPPPGEGAAYWQFYTADAAAMFFKRIALATTIIVLVMSVEYRGVLARYLPQERPGAGLGEFYALPVLTCAGLMFMASAIDFLSIFVSIELVTISFYILVSYMRRHTASLEAGVKYLILGALSTGFLIYGITWIFGVTGETNLVRLAAKLPEWHGSETALLFGLVLVLVGLGFKVAAVPFQIWVPDVYQGAPTPITAFLSVGSKAAGFIVLMRVVEPFLSLPHVGEKLLGFIAILAAATLIYGNLAAMPQDNLKRMLAYSSIGHAGYLLVGIASIGRGEESATGMMFGAPGMAISFYLAGYLLMTLLSFLVLIVVSKHSRGEEIVHFNGLAKRSPFLALGMLVSMLSLAGIPFTAGFYGKFLIFAAAVQQNRIVLVVIGAITVAAGFYYYLRVVTAMYWQEPTDETPITMAPITRVVITVLAVAIIVFGIAPGPILNFLRQGPRVVSTGPVIEAAPR